MDENANSSESGEKRLIELSLKGDNQAFSTLVGRYEEMVFNFAFKVCRDRASALETTQDTFVNVFLKLKQYKAESKFSTWLYSIVTNNCLMKRRKSKLEEASFSIDRTGDVSEDRHVSQLASSERDPSERMLTVELREALDKAMLKLPVEYRVVFVMRDLEGLTAEEVSHILNLSVPAVKSRLRRARVFLKKELQPFMEE